MRAKWEDGRGLDEPRSLDEMDDAWLMMETMETMEMSTGWEEGKTRKCILAASICLERTESNFQMSIVPPVLSVRRLNRLNAC